MIAHLIQSIKLDLIAQDKCACAWYKCNVHTKQICISQKHESNEYCIDKYEIFTTKGSVKFMPSYYMIYLHINEKLYILSKNRIVAWN